MKLLACIKSGFNRNGSKAKWISALIDLTVVEGHKTVQKSNVQFVSNLCYIIISEISKEINIRTEIYIRVF